MASDFDTAFAPLLAILEDPDARFHGQTMVDDLQAIEPLVSTDADAARLYRELSYLQAKRWEPAAIAYADKAFTANAVANVLTPKQLFWTHVLCARVAGDVGMNDSARALQELQAALEHAVAAEASVMDTLSLRQDVGMYLHELDRFDEALAANMAVLADGEALLGADSADLNVVLNNIAENHYKLGDFDMARQFLRRRIAVLDPAGEHGKVFDTLFKLGVLSFEEDDYKTAKALFKQRLQLAKRERNETWVEMAKETLSEYYDRLGRPRAGNTT